MDLIFLHHECEIAQSVAAVGHPAVKYWIHNNMITINGQKMGKSLGNFITLEEFFTLSTVNIQTPSRASVGDMVLCSSAISRVRSSCDGLRSWVHFRP